MNIIWLSSRLAALLLLLLIPGLAGLRLFPAEERRGWAGRVFIVVFCGLLTMSLASFILAIFGAYSLPALAVSISGVALALWILGRGRAATGRPAESRGLDLAFAGILALGMFLYLRPHGYVMGGWDPGIYVNTAASIASGGGIRYRDDFFAGLGSDRRFFTGKFSNRFDGFDLTRGRTGQTTPHFYHLLPSVMAVFFSLFGGEGPLWVVPLFGLASLAAFLALCRRVLGGPASLLATLLLAANLNQVWFSRFPVPETAAQFLVVSGFVLLGGVLSGAGGGTAVAAALAFEAAALAKVDVLPLILLLLLLGGFRIWTAPSAREEGFVLALLALHGLFEPYRMLLARAYTGRILADFGATLPTMAGAFLATAAFLLAGAALRGRRGGPPLPLPTLPGLRWRALPAAAVAGFCLWAWLARPHLPPRLDALNFVALGWLMTPVALGLAVTGLVMAVLMARGPLWFYLLGSLGPVSYLAVASWKMEGLHYWSTKRYQVAVIPLALLGFGYLADRLWARRRTLRAALTVLCLVVAAVPLVQASGWITRSDYAEYPAFLSRLAGRFRGDDVVLCRTDRIAVGLRFLHGVETLVFTGDDAASWETAARWTGRWAREGRRTFLVSEREEKSLPPGWEREGTVPLRTSRLERRTDRLPTRRETTEASLVVYAGTAARMIPAPAVQSR